MTVNELNREQINQLKEKIFFDWNSDATEELKETMTYDDYTTLNRALSYMDIPDEIVFALYDGVYFVEEDFCKGDEN